MTVKEYLSRPKELKEEIRCDLDNLAALRSIVENCTASLSFTAGCGASKDDRGFEDVMIAIAEEEERIRKKVEELAAIQIDVLGLISTLKDHDQQTVLRLRFLNEMIWPEIGKTMSLSKRYAMQLQQEALQELENSAPDITK